MYNDAPGNNSGDWVEFYNPTEDEVSLENWKFTDKGDYRNWLINIDLAEIDSEDIFFFPADAKIPAKGYLVVCRNIENFKDVNSDVDNCMGDLPFKLSCGETVLLFNSKDELANALSFQCVKPWPSAPDGRGPSLELVHADRLNYLPLNWAASKKTGGTPGKENSASPVIRPAKTLMPLTYLLGQNYPNPCRAATTIRFALPVNNHVRISIYSLSGRLLETVINGKVRAGIHEVKWDTRKYSAGVYFYRIQTGGFVATKKLTIQ